jgi:ketosteroid isomerase-like protein
MPVTGDEERARRSPRERSIPPPAQPMARRSHTLLPVAAAENKQLMQRVFAQLANGNGQPFMDALANDARWTVIGSSPWSRTYEGKRAITDELMRPLFHQFANQYKARAIRIVAEDDVVVVEARGEATTKSGKPYNQTYCYVFQLTDGKVRKLTEYLDTDLVNQVLETPASR